MTAGLKKVSADRDASGLPQDAHVLWELLEFAPVSLWIENWSLVKRTLEEWRATGVADPVALAAADISRLETLARAIRVIDVNATSISVYDAPDKTSLITDYESHAVKILCHEMREFFLDALNAFYGRQTHVGVEAWDTTFSGRPIRVHISCSMAPEDKNWERAVLAIKDVTEAWQARAALDASRDLLAQAASLARLAHWIRDGATGAVLHCGEEIADVTGRSAAEWTRLVEDDDVESYIAADDRAAYRDSAPPAIAAARPYTIEYRLSRRDGDERWVRERGAPLRQGGSAGLRYLCTLQDITEQRRAETARQDAEAELQGFLKHAPFAMFVKDLDRRYRYVNQQAAMRFGRPIEQVVGRRPDDVLPRETASLYREQDDRVLSMRAPVVEETRAEGPVGEIWAEHIRFPIFDEAGNVRAIGGIAIDVTERKREETARHETEAQLRAFFENADVLMILKDAAGRCQLVSRGFERLYGLTNEQVRGKTVQELMPRDFADSIDTLEGEVAKTGRPQIEQRVLRRNGRTIHMTGIRFPIIGPDGSLTGTGTVSTDISELKRAEAELREQHEFLRLVIDTAAAFIVVLDGANRLVTCNRAYEEFSGMTAEDLARDENWTKVVVPEDLGIVREALKPDNTAKFPTTDLTRSIRADGDVRTVQWVNAAFVNADGSIRNIVCIGTDITEQRRAESALRESEARLKAFIDNASFEMVLKDREGRYLMANEHVAAVLGVPLDRLLGQSITDIAANPSAPSYAEHDRAVFESGKPVSRLTSWETTDGTHWTQEIKFPIRNALGQITGIGGIGIDVTQQMRTEEALRTSEARWQAFKDNAPFPIFYKHPDGRYLDVNRQAERFWNRPHDEVIGRTTEQIAETSDKRLFAEQDREVLRIGKPVTREYHFPQDPQAEWVRDVKFPIRDAGGQIVAIGGIGIDITEAKRAQQALQQSEANLRAVVEGIVEGIVIFDETGTIRSISRAAEHMFGCRATDLTGRGLGALFPKFTGAQPGGGRAAFLGEIERWIGKSQELEAVVSNGQQLTVAFSINELPPSDNVRLFIGTILDLTPHKLLEDRLRQAQKMETIGQFTGGIAHDFNNLLAVILGNLDLLASRISEDRARTLVERASGAAQRGADLTRRLLAFARRQQLEPAPVDVAGLVQEMIPLVERTVGPEIQIKPVLADGLWRALVDRVQLEAALLNLIGNARDAMPGGGQLIIRTANYEAKTEAPEAAARLQVGRYVELAVIDSGTGMTPEVVQRAFEPFFTTKGVGRGTGLGLSMVHGFVQQSGGDVRITSRPGYGTTICLYLPATELTAVADATPGELAKSWAHSGRRILVVDDEPEVLALVKELLVGLGYLVEIAATGAEALEQLRRPDACDLLLTDVRMKGGMSGPQLAAQAKAVRADLRVLFMTGYDDVAGREGGVPKGANLLLKPFRNSDLATSVARALSD